MREMKGPRVWDDELGKMLYSKFEQYDDSIGFRFSEHLETENPVYMWPVGLKDKNGVEIYEGDIVEGNFPEMGIDRGVVVFEQGFQVEIPGIDDLDNLYDWTKYTSSIEVLGNIYENPELLK